MFGWFVELFICAVNVSVLIRVVCIWRLANGSLLDNVWIATADIGGVNTQTTPNVIPYTTDLASYGYDVTNNRFIQFKVRSCRDAFVTLIESYDTPVLFDLEIAIWGDKTAFYLKIGPGYAQQVYLYTPEILDCNEFRPFWISWSMIGEIRFGKGLTLFNEELFYWETDTPVNLTFKGIAIRSSWGANGTWTIHNKANPIGKFCGRANTFADMDVLDVSVMDSIMKCTIHCRQHNDCLAVNFHSVSRECRLIRGNQLIETYNMENWIFMANCLQGLKACIACI